MRLKFLNLPSLQRRRERYIIINTWKILHKKAPNDIKMVFYESDRLGVRAKVPPEQKNCPSSISSIYENSFSVKAAKLWNILPKSVNTAKDLDSLKVAPGKFLERFQDTPPGSNSVSCSFPHIYTDIGKLQFSFISDDQY